MFWSLKEPDIGAAIARNALWLALVDSAAYESSAFTSDRTLVFASAALVHVPFGCSEQPRPPRLRLARLGLSRTGVVYFGPPPARH